MKSEDSDKAAVASAETEPEEQVTEQKSVSYADELLKVAQAEGMVSKDVEPRTPPEGEDDAEEPVEEEEPLEVEEPLTDEEDAETEEEQAAAKKEGQWPESATRRVAEESDKRRKATEERDNATRRITELEAQLAQATAPQPTPQNPLIDLQDEAAITRVENSYESLLELAETKLAEPWVDEYGERIAHKTIKMGKDREENFTREDLVQMKIKADRALRKDIPQRRQFLAIRAQADAQAFQAYPELTDQTSDFPKEAAVLLNAILTGRAASDPELLFWVAHALKGRQQFIARNGKGAKPNVERIVESAKTKLAPTPVKTRSFTRRGSSSELAQAKQELEQKKTVDAAERYVASVFSKSRGGAKRLDRVSE